MNEILGKTGVDMSLFKAHSNRGASGMMASERRVLIEDILVLLIGTQTPNSVNSTNSLLTRITIHAYKQDLVHGRPVLD